MSPIEFKTTRETLALSKRQLAYILNLSVRMLDHIESGRRTPGPTVQRVMVWMKDHNFRPPEFPRD